MHKLAPFLVGVAVTTFFYFHTASQIPDPTAGSPKSLSATPAAVGNPSGTPSNSSPATPRPATSQRPYEPAYKVLIRCMSDVDDLLDTIHDRATFEAVWPKVLNRVRQHVAEGKEHPNPVMTQMSRAAQKELVKATKRHDESVTRADRAVPGVRKRFEKEVAEILPK